MDDGDGRMNGWMRWWLDRVSKLKGTGQLNIDLLHANGVFGLYVGLTRGIRTRDYNYQLTAWEDAEC